MADNVEISNLPVIQRLAKLEAASLVVRWTLAFFAVLWLLPDRDVRPSAFYAWLVLASVNFLFLTVLYLRRRFTIYLYYLSTLADLLLVTGAVYVAGEAGYALLPLYLLVIAEATLKFSWRGGVLSAGLVIVLAALAIFPSWVLPPSNRWLWAVIVVSGLAAVAATSLVAERELAAYAGAGVRTSREGIERDVLLQVVGQMSGSVAAGVNLRSILGVIRDFFQADSCLLYDIRDEGARLEVAASVESDLELFRLWQGLYTGKMVDCPVPRGMQALVVEDRYVDAPCGRFSDSERGWLAKVGGGRKPDLPCRQLIRARDGRAFMCAPVPEPSGKRGPGVLHCASLRPYAFSKDDLELLASLGKLLAPAWEKLEAAAEGPDPYLDPASGLYNRVYFDQRLEEEMSRAHRYRRGLSLVLLWLDRTTGGSPGDLANQETIESIFAQCVKKRIRQVDAACQVESGQIAIILPETEREQAARAADRIRRDIEKSLVGMPDGSSVSAPTSLIVGVATLLPGEADGQSFLRRAKAAAQPTRSTT